MNKIRARWAARECAIAAWLQIPAALHAEALARCGFDGLVVDLQHSPIDFATALTMLAAIEAGGAEPLVRLQSNDGGDIMKLLDSGAYGVICPMIDTAEQAKQFASALHYPPKGVRSYGPRRPVMRYGADYLRIASDTIVALAMIETATGLQNLDAILEVDGIDGVFIGPTDLAIALGAVAEMDSRDPRVLAAVAQIRTAAHAHGKKAGIFCVNTDFARAKIEEGFDFVSIATDVLAVTQTARAALAQVKAHGRTT